MRNKKCSTCKKIKSVKEFGIHNFSKDGLRSRCLQCKRAHQKKTAHALGRRLIGYKKGAQSRGYVFNISRNEFKNITEKQCIYCGKYSNSYNNKPFCGIDRIDPNKGYVKKNVVPCCLICNMMKGTLTYNEFVNHTRDIYDNLKLSKKRGTNEE
jgi:hypothetical protein